MSPRGRLISLRLDDEVLAALEDMRHRFGTPVSEQIRRAIDAWLANGGVLSGVTPPDAGPSAPARQQTARRRADTRKRA